MKERWYFVGSLKADKHNDPLKIDFMDLQGASASDRWRIGWLSNKFPSPIWRKQSNTKHVRPDFLNNANSVSSVYHVDES